MSKSYWEKRYQREGDTGTVSFRGSSFAAYWRQGWNIWNGPVRSFMEEFRQQHPEGTVIDYGCGSSRFLPFLMNYFSHYIGIDLSEEAIHQAWARYKMGHDHEVSYIQADVCRHLDCHARLIWCCTVLQHITNDKMLGRTLDCFAEWCPPGGFVILIEDTIDDKEEEVPNHPYVMFRSIEEYNREMTQRGFVSQKNVLLATEHTMMVFQKGELI